MRGIVTWGDRNFYPGVELLARSVRRVSEMPVAVVDMGMRAAQRALLVSSGVAVLRAAPFPPLPGRWWIWGKPFQIPTTGPFDDFLFVDSDLVFLRDPGELLARLEAGPVLVPEVAADTSNPPLLYERLSVPGPVSPAIVNAGVTGWRMPRDLPLLEEWRRLVDLARGPELRHAFCCGEQGCLLWLVQSHRLESRIAEDAWGATANHLPSSERKQRKRYARGPGMLDAIAADHPDDGLVHWHGRPKWWE